MYPSGIDQHKRDSYLTTYGPGGAIVNQARPPTPGSSSHAISPMPRPEVITIRLFTATDDEGALDQTKRGNLGRRAGRTT